MRTGAFGVRAIAGRPTRLRFESHYLGAGPPTGNRGPWSYPSRAYRSASLLLPALRGQVGVDEWHHQDRPTGPREFTGIVDHSRGGCPTARLLDWSQAGHGRAGWPSGEDRAGVQITV